MTCRLVVLNRTVVQQYSVALESCTATDILWNRKESSRRSFDAADIRLPYCYYYYYYYYLYHSELLGRRRVERLHWTTQKSRHELEWTTSCEGRWTSPTRTCRRSKPATETVDDYTTTSSVSTTVCQLNPEWRRNSGLHCDRNEEDYTIGGGATTPSHGERGRVSL